MKLNNPKTISKIYCSILKTIYGSRKIPVNVNLILKLRLTISINILFLNLLL